MPAGRPTKYDPAYCDLLIEKLSEGISFEAFAGVIGVCKDTLYEWCKVYPDFSDAKSIGTQKGQLFWETQGIKSLWQDEKSKFNSTVWIFAMKNRFKWTDKVEVNGADQENANPIMLSYKV